MSMKDVHYAPSIEMGAATDEDDKGLEKLGYVPSFQREFTNLATVSAVPRAVYCALTAPIRSRLRSR